MIGLLRRLEAAQFLTVLFIGLVLRVRFLSTPISSDEGGYLAIARAWGRGAVLYRDVWVDRPQGLLVVYRLLIMFGLGNPVGIRFFALVACVVGSLACGSIARTIAGSKAGWYAAVIATVLTSLPQIEGFIANAELVSGAIGAVSMAVGLQAAWKQDKPSMIYLLMSGVIGGCAISIKQSGFDAFGVISFSVAFGLMCTGWSWRRRLQSVLVMFVGFCMPVVAMTVHGAATGWHRWWYAVVGYRKDQRSILVGADWEKLRATYVIVAPALWPIIFVIVASLIILRGRISARILAISWMWMLLGVCAFLVGGQFHRHYWVILMFPLSVNVGVVVSQVRHAETRGLLLIAVLAIPSAMMVTALRVPRQDVGFRLEGDSRLTRDEQIGKWFTRHSSALDRIYALCASAAIYGNITADPPFPYLWFDNVQQVPHARELISVMLESNTAPRFVALAQSADVCDYSGKVQLALDENYHKLEKVGGVQMLEHN